MEKYYIVTTESDLYKEYLDYKDNIKAVNEIVKEVLEYFNVETKIYAATNEYLYIEPTENDLHIFVSKGQLSSTNEKGLYAFKKNSKIGKLWIDKLDEKNMRVKPKPLVQFYFNVSSKARYRLFDIDDVVYVSYESVYDFDNPKGFEEIKGSEFYKTIEDHNSKIA